MSPRLAIITIVKGAIGAGALGLPKCFGLVGLGLAIPGAAVLAWINAFGAWRLVQSKVLLQYGLDATSQAREELQVLREEDEVGLGPVAAVGKVLYGVPGQVAGGLGVLGTQIGICLTHVVMIRITLDRMFEGVAVPGFILQACLCAILCTVCLLRQLQSLAWLSLAALVTYAYAFVALVRWGAPEIIHQEFISTSQAFLPVRWPGVPSWFGSSVYAFEGIVLAQYAFDAMQLGPSPEPFKRILAWSFGICFLVFGSIGCVGFLAYGNSVEVPFYLNFPKAAIDTWLLDVIVVLVLIMSFALQAFPIFSFLDALLVRRHAWRQLIDERQRGWSQFSFEQTVGAPSASCSTSCEGPESSSSQCDITETAPGRLLEIFLRCLAVVGICLLGAIIPAVSCVTDLTGSVFMSLMGFLLPGAFHLKVAWSQLSTVGLAFDLLLICTGATAMTIGLAQAPSCFANAAAQNH